MGHGRHLNASTAHVQSLTAEFVLHASLCMNAGASKERHFLTADKDVEGAPEGGVEAWEGVAGSGEFDAEKREYIITAGRRYADGDQVLLCYGRCFPACPFGCFACLHFLYRCSHLV